jgi:hypothetical protein
MAHATCIAVSTGVHLHRTTYPATLLHARLNTTTAPARDHEHHGCHVQRPPHPARRRGADACPSRLRQQSRILSLALARVSGQSRELTPSPPHHHHNSQSRKPASPEYYRFVYSGIDNCTRLLLQHAALDAQNAALLPRQTPYLRYPQHYPVHSHYAVMINTSSTFNPPTTLQPSPHQRLR